MVLKTGTSPKVSSLFNLLIQADLVIEYLFKDDTTAKSVKLQWRAEWLGKTT